MLVGSPVCVTYAGEASRHDRGDGPALIRMSVLKGLFLVHALTALWHLSR
jgi:hypothetical protein